MTGLWKEFRYAARGLVREPGTAFLAVLALGLGIGLTTVMFSIVNGAILQGLPFEASDRILHLERANLSEGIESMEVTIHDFVDWRAQQASFGSLAAYYEGTVNVSGTERAERYDGAFVTASTFSLLRVRPALGRLFREDEDEPGAAPVIVLGYHVWQDRYAGDPGVLDRTIRVNGEQATIVGVMPEGFRFPIAQDVWVPLRMDPVALERGEGTTLEVVGRLRDGVSPDRAAAEMQTIASRLAEEYPETNEGVSAVVQPFTHEYVGDEPRAMLFTMLAAVFLVLLIACANVANLLLARTVTRSRELAIRSAIGASRWRVVFHLLAEGLTLALAGAVLGIGIAWVGIGLFNRAIAPTDPPFWIQVGLQTPVLLFVLGITALAGIVSGLAPALQASGKALNEILKDESRGSSGFRIGRLSRGLVVAEVALSVGLLVGAGLMIRSVAKLGSLDYGFATEEVFTARLGLFETDYPDSTSRRAFFRELVPRLAALPGARGAAATTALPGIWNPSTPVTAEGRTYDRDQDVPFVRFAAVTPGFFEVLDVEVARGRGFRAQDGPEGTPVAVVNRSFAARHFSGEDPLGRRIRLGRGDEGEPWRTIVGVVPDLYMEGVENRDGEPDGLYIPLAQSDARFVSLAIRAGSDPMRLAGPARDIVTRVDPNLPLYWVRTLQAGIDETTWYFRVFGTLFAVFGLVALLLASIGLYGVMATSVGNRTTEIGIRMALGAGARDVLRLVLRQGLAQIALGTGAGIVLAFFLARGLQLLLYDVAPWDPTTFVLILTVLGTTGLLASWLPARRATRVHPMAALRYE